MKKLVLRNGILGAFLALGTLVQAQQSNVFFNREFWGNNPSVETVDLKIKAGNDPAKLNERSFDPVTMAILQGASNPVTIHLLDQKGNDVNKLTHDGRTYIFWAANKGNVELMEYLIKKGAKIDILDNHGYSVLNFAAATGQKNTKVYDLCLANGANLKTDLDHHGANAMLLVSQRAKDFETINYFTSKGLDLNAKDADGNGIFNYVAKSGNIDMLNQLIAKGVDYKYVNKEGGNAMIFASKGGRGSSNGLDVFKYLESKGIKPNITTKDGVNPLHGLASSSKDLAAINYFLEKGVSVNQANKDGNTPFLNAASRNNLEVVKTLKKHVKDINVTNKKGESALSLAVQNNNTEVVSYLLDNGADIDVVDANGNNLTVYLVKSFSPRNKDDFNSKKKLLIAKGLDISKAQANGNTLYHLALDQNSEELLALAKQNNVNINAVNNDGMSPLLQAAMSAKDDTILKYLIEEGADKSVKTDFDETAFDLASENELLKANNVNINFLK